MNNFYTKWVLELANQEYNGNIEALGMPIKMEEMI